jgi:hypothetical protein
VAHHIAGLIQNTGQEAPRTAGTDPDGQISQGILNDRQPIESLVDIAYRWLLVPRETDHV